MNKTFKKYGKVSFKSIIPRRLKRARSIRLMRACAIASAGVMNLRVISASAMGDKVFKAIAISKSMLQTQESIAKILTHTK